MTHTAVRERLSGLPLGAVAVFAVAMGAYVPRLLGGVGFWDTGIFQTASPTLSLTHPTRLPHLHPAGLPL